MFESIEYARNSCTRQRSRCFDVHEFFGTIIDNQKRTKSGSGNCSIMNEIHRPSNVRCDRQWNGIPLSRSFLAKLPPKLQAFKPVQAINPFVIHHPAMPHKTIPQSSVSETRMLECETPQIVQQHRIVPSSIVLKCSSCNLRETTGSTLGNSDFL